MSSIAQRSVGYRVGAVAGLLAALVASGALVRADDPKVPGLSDSQKARNLESFDVVWTTIRDKHFDPRTNGVDWQAVREELRPKVVKAATMAEARAAMTEALDRLHQTHFGIIPIDVARTLDEPKAGSGETGIEVRLVESKVVVTRVEADSTGAKAGVRPGWVVDKVGGKPVADLLAAAEKAYAKSGMLAARKVWAVSRRLTGPVGDTIAVDFLDGDDKPARREVELGETRGEPARFGHLPTFHVRFVARKIDGPVEYTSLNAFFGPVSVMRQFADAIKEARDCDGLILDLRGNPGGIGAMSMGMGGFLATKPNLKLGTMSTREGSINFILLRRASPYAGPVAVLVDELSMSTSEILAGGLKDLGRARVFGAKTPGAALPSRVDILPNGDRFQYAFANYISVGGKPLEGVGVTPDVEVPLTRAALLGGADPAVDAAVRWIREQKAKP